MSYVVTIERPAGKSPLRPQDFARLVKNDESLSKTNEGVLIWTHPTIRQDFYLTIESNHLWADGVTRDKTDEFVEKLREIAGRLDARVYGEEGEDITESELGPMGAKEKWGGAVGILLVMVSMPFFLILFIVRLPWVMWRMWRAVK